MDYVVEEGHKVRLVVPERQQEWRWNLESLQSHHRNESREQQEQHLQQLRLLQEQLLRDVNLNLSAVAGQEGGENHPLPSQNIQPPVCEAESEANSICQYGESRNLKGSTSLPDNPLTIEDGRCGKKSVDSINSSSLLRECGSGKWSPPNTRTVIYKTEEGEDTESWDIGHKNTIHAHPPPINGTHAFSRQNKKQITDISPPSHAALSLSLNSYYMRPTNSPARVRDVSPSPKFPLSPATPPPFFPLSHKQAWEGPFLHPPSPLNLSTRVPPSPKKKLYSGYMTQNLSGVFEKRPITQSIESHPFRASLLEKHVRHMHDLKTFYESELSTLRERLHKVEQGGKEDGLVTTSTRRSLNFNGCVKETGLPVNNDNPLSGNTEQVALVLGKEREKRNTDLERVRSVEMENRKLEEECCKLQALLNEARKQHHIFVRKEALTKEHMGEWQRRCESADRTAAALQEQLEAVRKEAQEDERIKERLMLDLQILTEELQVCRAEGEQDMVKMDRLLHELGSVQLENDELRQLCTYYNLAMEDKNAELASLRKTVIQQKETEAQDKSMIRNLENEVRHLEHLKNRLHNMGTHYIQSDQQRMGSVQDHKSPICSRSQSPGPEHSSGKSSGSVRMFTTPIKEALQVHVDIVDPTPVSSHSLTRRKWLEPSDPALFGVTPIRHGESRLSGGGDGSADWKDAGQRTSLSEKREGDQSGRGSVEEVLVRGYNGGRVVVDKDVELASSMLQAIKEGRVSTAVVEGRAGGNKSKKKTAEMNKSTDEKVKQRLRAEEKLAGLQAEKDKLESALWRIPRPGSKVNKSIKLAQLDKEKRLEEVRREIGLTRMALRDNHTRNT